ncbi:MAG: YgiQ family radical SAM protein [Desulfuromonas sp.]|nr:MAG: YgiQ family radical SAM protein [Desulfuromonas sp.]
MSAIAPISFIPTCRAEMTARGWQELDVLFISGDAYVDHPAFGVPLLARWLEAHGYRVAIIAQPDWNNPEPLKALGRPRLCACVGAGAMDSMVNHYTAAKKVRNDDAYTPGGRAGLRPDRATIAYTGLVKRAFKGLPVIIGGIEASLRRLAHYDYWDNKVRRSILVDSKADLLIYGMAENVLLEVVQRLDSGECVKGISDLRGTACQVSAIEKDIERVPSFEQVAADPMAYNEAFRLAQKQNTPSMAKTLAQGHAKRFVVVNPPAPTLTAEEIDRIYALPFRREPHPSYTETIPAYEQIRWSITTHRGCYGGCSFCAIAAHQGKDVVSRSSGSILKEIQALTHTSHFRGTISDLGGPTANMYGTGCGDPAARRKCKRPSCLWPEICPHLETSDRRGSRLLRQARTTDGVKHVFVASGLRTDLLERQQAYFSELILHHTGGLLKVAPETTVNTVARIMHKPGPESFLKFLRWFWKENKQLGRKRGVVPYLIAGHPGCTISDMVDVALFLREHRLRVEQVQEFTPTPGSLATCIYHTGRHPMTDDPIHVPRDPEERQLQKALLLYHQPQMRNLVRKALQRCHRMEETGKLLGQGIKPPKTDNKLGASDRNATKHPRRTRKKPGRH